MIRYAVFLFFDSVHPCIVSHSVFLFVFLFVSSFLSFRLVFLFLLVPFSPHFFVSFCLFSVTHDPLFFLSFLSLFLFLFFFLYVCTYVFLSIFLCKTRQNFLVSTIGDLLDEVAFAGFSCNDPSGVARDTFI